jgi:hypothetical protein
MLRASSLRRTPFETLIMIKIISRLNSVRRYEGRRKNIHENE